MREQFRTYVFVILLTIISNFGYSQDGEIPIYNNGLNIQPTISFNNDFNLDDWYMGVSGGIEDLGYQWGARIGFAFRPFRKKIQVIGENDIIRQYHERKYLIFIDVDKRLGHLKLFNQHLQFYLGARGGFLMGNYAGTKQDADNVWVIAPIGGLCFNFKEQAFLKIGYNHFSDKLLNVDDGRINLSLIVNLRN